MTNLSRPHQAGRVALAMASALLLTTAAGARPLGLDNTLPCAVAASEHRPNASVFDDINATANDRSSSTASPADERRQWLTFYLLFTDDELSRYAPGGATGARFDLFQHAGFAGSQPTGYSIHITVRHGHTRLTGTVLSTHDRERADELARGVAGVLDVDNDLQVASVSTGE